MSLVYPGLSTSLPASALIDNCGSAPWRQDLQRLQEFDDAILVISAQRLKCETAVEGFAVRVLGAGRDVVEFEIGESSYPDNAVFRLQSRWGQFVTGKVDREGRRFARA